VKSYIITSLQVYLRFCLCLVDFNMIQMCINPSMSLYIFLNHGPDGKVAKGKIYNFMYVLLSLILILQGQYVLYSIQLGSTTSFLVN